MKLALITVISLPSWRASEKTESINVVTWFLIQAASASKRTTITVQSFWANLKNKTHVNHIWKYNGCQFNLHTFFTNKYWQRFSHCVDRILGHYVIICLLFYLPRTLVLCTHLHNRNNVQLASGKCCWYNGLDNLNIHLRSDLYYNLLNIWMNT